MKKRILYLLLIVTLLLQNFLPISASSAGILYTNEENRSYVEYLRKLDAFTLYEGDSVFFDDKTPVKRYEAARALLDIMGYSDMKAPEGSVGKQFYDVPDYYKNAGDISLAVKMGLMNGVGNGLFEPESPILKIHFLKALISAIGYSWKADALGGYPNGYAMCAHQLGLLENVTGDLNTALTREEMVRILYNVLDVNACEFVSINGEDVSFKINDDVTILNSYHNIWIDEGIVYSSSSLSLDSSFEPSAKRILIGKDILELEESENVFNYFGYNVEYIYKYNKATGKKVLIGVSPQENNFSATLGWRDITNVNTSQITFCNEQGKEKKYKIDTSACFIYNGEQITSGVNDILSDISNFVTIVDNDENGSIDFVFVYEYTYDVVDMVDVNKLKLYCKENLVDLDVEDLFISTTEGAIISEKDIKAGDVVGVAKGNSGKHIEIIVLKSRPVITVGEISEDGIISADGESYLLFKDFSDKSKIKPGIDIEIVLNQHNEIIAVFESTDEKIGYLIKAAFAQNSFGEFEKVELKILSAEGIVLQIPVLDKIKFNGANCKKEDLISLLTNSKNSLDLSSDGVVSQVVLYRVNADGALVEIRTATANDGLNLHYNHNTKGTAYISDLGYGSGYFGVDASHLQYAITSNGPIFQVPESGQDEKDDEYYNVISYSTNNIFPSSQGYTSGKLESYISEENEIIPMAYVLYKEAVSDIKDSAALFLLDKVTQATNADGDACSMLYGIVDGKSVKYEVDPSVVLPTDLEPGDVLTLGMNELNVVKQYRKIYDVGTETVVYEPFATARPEDKACVKLIHIYNAPANSKFFEGYITGFENGIPGDDKKYLSMAISSSMYFDLEQQEAVPGIPPCIVGYQSDSQNYTKALVRYGSRWIHDVIFYTK